MTRAEYMAELDKLTAGFPEHERARILSYYEEMLSDRIEAGESEESATAQLGDPASVIKLLSIDLDYKTAEKKASMSGWLKALFSIALIFAAPIAVPILIALLAVVFSVAFAIIATLASVFVAFAAVLLSSVVGIPYSIWLIFQYPQYGLFQLGVWVFVAGVGCFAVLTTHSLIKRAFAGLKSVIKAMTSRIYKLAKAVKK